MKKVYLFLTILMLGVFSLFAQAPEKFTYQAVVRNANNQLVTSTLVGVRVSILQGSANGSAVYSETQMPSTNANGLLTLTIGDGSVVFGSLEGIDWSAGPYFLKTEIDPNGGMSFTITSTQQLLSVPYALYAKEAGNTFSGDYNDLTNTPTIPQTVGELTNDAGYITQEQVPAQVNADWNASDGAAQILNKPTIPTVPTNVSAFNNDAGYITNADIPEIPTVPTNVSAFNNDAGYITMDSIPAIPQNVSELNNDAGYITGYTETDPQFNAWDKDYNDLINRPTIPQTVGELTNDANYITLEQVPAQVNADWNATDGAAQILNKPTIPTVPTNVSAFNNDAGYITNADIPEIPTVPTNVSAFNNDAGYITMDSIPAIPQNVSELNNDAGYITGYTETDPQFNAWDKDYNDLINRPTIPQTVGELTNDANYITLEQVPAQVNADWNATDGAAQILNKPTIPTVPTNVSAFNNDAGYITNADIPEIPTVPTNVSAFTNDAGYITMDSIPAIPQNVSELNNDAGYITGYTETDPQFNAWDKDYNDLTNKPNLADVATSGSYNDLSNKPNFADVATSGNYNDLSNKPTIPTVPTNVSAFVNDAGYLTAIPDGMGGISVESDPIFSAWDKNYNDLTNKPTLFSGNYNDLTNKPNFATVATSGNYNDLSNKPTLATVATSGNYNDLSNTPTIPTVPTDVSAFNNDAGYITGYTETDPQFNAWDKNYNDLSNKPNLATVATSGSYNDLTNKPTLATVATSGNYNDLSNTPTIPTVPTDVSAFDNDAGYITDADLPTVNDATLTIKQNGSEVGTFTANQSTNQTVDIDAPTFADVQALINSSLAPLQNQVDQLQNQNAALQSSLDNMNFICGTSTVRDYDGNEYNTVKIGEQCWLKENLRSTHYSDGTEIPDGGSTESNTTGYRYDYTSSSIPLEQRGYLYNWPAVMHGAASSNAVPSGVQGICPVGWHVPSDAEWTQLTGYVSGQSQYLCGGNSANIAKALAAATTWGYDTYVCSPCEDPASNDATGFSAVAAGYYSYPSFDGTNGSANITTSTADGTSMSWYYNLNYMTEEVYRQSYYKSTGLSVRCLRDATSTIGEQLIDMQQQNASLQEELDNMNFVCGVSTVKDYDGNEYNTVRIGNQCWTKENLRSEHYADGTEIPDGGTNGSTTTGYRYNYTSSSIPFEQRGYLYNWAAVMHGEASSNAIPSGVQGICPVGWHVPSDAEWTTMEQTQTCMDVTGSDMRGDHAGKLAGEGWEPSTTAGAPGNASDPDHNASGFSAVPAGYCDGSSFFNVGSYANFWSSTLSLSYNAAYGRGLAYYSASVGRGYGDKYDGYSVRCLRDNLSMTEQLNSANEQIVTQQEQIVTQQEQLDNMNFVCGVSTVKDYDGNEYNTVKIGNQCWTKENLRSEHYSNGVEIPAGTTTSTTTGYRYNNTSSSIPFKQRGYLYNWAAVMHGEASSNAIPSGVQGICPVGWHVPSHAEWTQLTDYVSSQSQYLCDASDNTSIAKALAASAWWNSSSTDCAVGKNPGNNNATDFAALPVGIYSSSSGDAMGSGNYVHFWSSTDISNSNAWYRYLNFNYDYVGCNYNLNKGNGFSVRCLRDVADGALGDLVRDLQEQNDNLSRVYECEHSVVMDYDGNVYNTVMIGNQCWMKENLRTTKYADGSSISNGGSNTSETTPYYYNYSSHSLPLETRGYLYNWAAVMHGAASSSANPSGVQGICPSGWHVPSDAEWTAMEATQTSMDVTADGWRGDHGGRLAGEGWNSSSVAGAPGNTNDPNHNASGFSAVPAGYCDGSSFVGAGLYAYFWSSTQNTSSYAYYRYLHYGSAYVVRSTSTKTNGRSVRCLRDN